MLKELHNVNFFSLTFGEKDETKEEPSSISLKMASIIQKKIADPNTNDAHRKMLEYKLQVHTAEKVGFRVDFVSSQLKFFNPRRNQVSLTRSRLIERRPMLFLTRFKNFDCSIRLQDHGFSEINQQRLMLILLYFCIV